MIRINLLPQKRTSKRGESSSQLWLVAILVIGLAEVAGCFVFHSFQEAKLTEQRKKNSQIKEQAAQVRRSVANHDEVKKALDQLRAKEEAIAKLQRARTGPTAVMLELSRVLSTGQGPSVSPERLAKIQKDNPLAAYDPSWDARRLWLTKLVEQQRKVRLEGLARDGEDVSELAQRLGLSSYFEEVKLLPAKKQKSDSGLELIKFELEAKVKY